MVSTMMSVEQVTIPEGYKQTEVGVIPEDWVIEQVGSVANVVDSLHQTPVFSVDGYAMVRVADIKTGNLNLKTTLKVDENVFKDFTRNYKPKKNDIVLSRVGSYGVSSFVSTEEDFCIGQNTVVIKSNISSKYLYYMLNSDATWQQIEDGSYGSGYKSLSLKNINELIIPIPEVKEQTAIANALTDVDSLIASLETLITKKSAIKTAAMQQLLTGKKRLPAFVEESEGKSTKESEGRSAKEDENKSEKKDPQQGSDHSADSGSMSKATQANASQMNASQINSSAQTAPRPGYKQTELGEIPEDWEVKTLDSISSVPMQNGLFYEPSRKGKGISLINVGDLYKAAPIAIDKLELFEASKSEVSTFRVTNGDLFFTRSSIVPSGIAYCNIYDTADNERDVVFDSHLIRVRIDSNIADAKYVYLACISNLARKFLISSAKTATMTTIDQGAIKQCPVLVPSKKEQTAIAIVLSDMDTELDALQQRLSKTQKIKQGMMQELLTGKTRLV